MVELQSKEEENIYAIKPPNLDDRQYADILEEMMHFPQYCPDGQGQVLRIRENAQLFSGMTEMVLYQVNQYERTYIHFLNFI